MASDPPRPASPNDVFRHPVSWRQIPRSEACAIAGRRVVVVVWRHPHLSADWFDRGHPFYRAAFAYDLGHVRYYVYELRRAPTPPLPQTSGTAPEPAPPAAPKPVRAVPAQKTWFEFQLLDAAGKPVSNEPCEITLSNGRELIRHTDGNGVVRVSDVDVDGATIALTRRANVEWDQLWVEESG